MKKVVLITGGAKRIGASTARYLHEKGIDIIFTYSNSSIEANNLKNRLNMIRVNLVIPSRLISLIQTSIIL